MGIVFYIIVKTVRLRRLIYVRIKIVAVIKMQKILLRRISIW